MSEVWLPLVEDGRETLTIQCSAGLRRARDRGRGRQGPSLMTALGLVEGTVLTYLEEHGATMLRDLIRSLEWSASMVRMGVGALIREGLVEGKQQDVNVMVSLR